MQDYTVWLVHDPHRRYFPSQIAHMLAEVFPAWPLAMRRVLVESLLQEGRCALYEAPLELAEAVAERISQLGQYGLHAALLDGAGRHVQEWSVGPCIMGRYPDSFKGRCGGAWSVECQGGVVFRTRLSAPDTGLSFFCARHGAIYEAQGFAVERVSFSQRRPTEPHAPSRPS
jgi:hypothetical protein